MKLVRYATTVCVALAFGALTSTPSLAVDWSHVPGKDIVLLYPAQMSWELLLTQSEHSGGGKFRDGKNCRQCHDGEEASAGKLLVSDKTAERAPISGKPGSIAANIKFTHDTERLYVRIAFDTAGQPDTGMDPKYDSKVAIMFDDGKVADVMRGGCWAACHDNLARMPSGGDSDTTMYLARSRIKLTRAGGTEIKPADDLAKMRADGEFLEYWQASLNPGTPAVATDGTILDKRQENTSPAVEATATNSGTQWTVEFSRKLVVGASHEDFVPGKVYTVGFAIHTGHSNRRFHYVTFEKTLVLDRGAADFVAVAAAP